MEKKKIEKWMNIVSKIVLFGGIFAIIASIHSLSTTFHLYSTGSEPGRFNKEINKNVGTVAEIIGIATGALWVVRKIWLEMKKRKWPFTDWIQQLFVLLRKRHIYLGILTLLLSFAHGVYFYLFVDERHQWTMYSGVVAFISLIILALLGWRHEQNKKTKKNQQTKKAHVMFAIIFAILFLVHLNL
jgi:hypothetical protein